MKKLIAVLLISAMAISISACTKHNNFEATSEKNSAVEQSSPIELLSLNENSTSSNITNSNGSSSVVPSSQIVNSSVPTSSSKTATKPNNATSSNVLTTVSTKQSTTKPTTTTPTAKANTPSTEASRFQLIIPTSSQLANLSNQVLSLINAERERCGVSALRTESKLTQAAQIRAKETITNNGHTRPNGTTWATVLDDVQYGTLRTSKQSYDDGKTWVDVTEYYSGAGAENLARAAYEPISSPNGFRATSAEFSKAAQKIFTDWKSSSGHYHSIINGTFTATGIGCAAVVKGNYMSIQCIEIFTEK